MDPLPPNSEIERIMGKESNEETRTSDVLCHWMKCSRSMINIFCSGIHNKTLSSIHF